MKWIHSYQLFLFDFDGLLVDTEVLHLKAYTEMCRQRGFELGWDLKRFCEVAHQSAHGLKDKIYEALPGLYAQEPRWSEVLYHEKQAAYMRILNAGEVELMSGVEQFLKKLEAANVRRCVVTNSRVAMIDPIRKALPILQSIPVWFTREDYANPKPNPECYLKAISALGKPGDAIIGFEDSWRGVQALLGAGAKPVMITPFLQEEATRLGLPVLESLDHLLDNDPYLAVKNHHPS